MYTATKDFKSYMLGDVKKGQEVDYNKSWSDFGLITEGKPEPKAEIETKPEPRTKVNAK